MARRTQGPKRRAERYGREMAKLIASTGGTIDKSDLARAYVAGYQSAARSRRKRQK